MEISRKSLAFVVIGLNSGGAERVLSMLANAFAGKYSILIITLKKTEIFYPLDSHIQVRHCAEQITPSKNPVEAYRNNRYLYKRIYNFLEEFRPDACISFMTKVNVLAIMACRKLRIPIVVSERNNPVVIDKELTFYWKWLRNFTYPKADALVVQTEGIKQFFNNIISPEKLEIIPNPINPDFYDDREVAKENIILNVGRLEPQKAQAKLLKSFARINNPEWKMIIIGEGRLRSELEELAGNLHIDNNVSFIGRTTDVSKFYKKSSIFAFTSIYEGFPNALLEAMHFGLACISTDCPTGPAELIQDGENGFLVELSDRDSFDKKLKLLMNDEGLRNKMGQKAVESVKRFSLPEVIKQWELILDDVIK